ncbi:hypothetical protein [Pseudoalteromonas sp. 68 DY56-GL68]|uniref:hypothetical protein n=1 Tax=Pseudoalteromonas sp. 68 DY56-GL68 TaxID=2974919 RepID=UPI00352A786B
MNTHTAAEKMLETGLFYTARTLGHAFGESVKHGTRCLKNIKRDTRYTTVSETRLGVDAIKVIAIDGRRVSIDQLQNKALLFKRPALLAGGSCHA